MSRNNQTKNPRNSENQFFKKITRIFSGPLVSRDRPTPRTLRRRNLDSQAKYFKSASGVPFKKSTQTHTAHHYLTTQFMSEQNRAQRYNDFAQMEFSPEIAAALNIYADEITTSSELREMLTIRCPNQEVKEVLKTFYKDIVNVNHNLFWWVRDLCKNGDLFLYLDVDEERGIENVIYMPTSEVERLEGEDPNNPRYVQFQWNNNLGTLEAWQVSHFRILGNSKYTPYGTSVLEPARRIFRQLDLLENAMMAYRIVRAPERRVFYVDVGHIEPEAISEYMLLMQARMKKNTIADSQTGQLDLRYNPLSLEEDYFIPVRGQERGTKIDTLQGGSWTGDVEDVKYLRSKLMTALVIPGEYLMNDEGNSTSLAQKDIRFARTILRLQEAVVDQLKYMAQIHLFTLGYRGEDLLNFTLALNNPSQLAELQEIESLRTKFDLASAATEGLVSKHWIYTKIFGFSKEEIRKIEIQRFTDKKIEALYESALESEKDFNELEDLSDLEGNLSDLTGMAGEVGSDGGAAGSLLAAPGKRDMTTTPRSKGKMYKPEASDSRGMGARNRHYKAISGGSISSASDRNVNRGMSNLRRTGRGIAESFEKQLEEFKFLLEKQLKDSEEERPSIVLESNYKEEEEGLFKDIDSINEFSLVLEKLTNAKVYDTNEKNQTKAQ